MQHIIVRSARPERKALQARDWVTNGAGLKGTKYRYNYIKLSGKIIEASINVTLSKSNSGLFLYFSPFNPKLIMQILSTNKEKND